MKIMKFGGTSVGSPQRMRDVAGIITDDNQRVFVVLSAMSGTTNSLIEYSRLLSLGNRDEALSLLSALEEKYLGHAEHLYNTDEMRSATEDFLRHTFAYLRTFADADFTLREEKIVVAHGEILSTNMFANYLHEQGVTTVLIPALDFMKTDAVGDPDKEFIRRHLNEILAGIPVDTKVIITQGFICRNHQGEIDNLLRGGSDYTASLIGAVIGADEIQIWTDIDGMRNNDPRFVADTTAVRHLHFEEASELAYFGAKILHPTCILPAREANVPVRLLNTMEPSAPGTIIDNVEDIDTIKAIAAKDNITSIKIKSSRMLLAYGFLDKVFHVFARYQTPIDMICTSEVGVSVSIDNTTHLSEILDDLKRYGDVTVDTGLCIVCVVGNMKWDTVGFQAKVVDAFAQIPVRMISYGGSNYNISFLIREDDKVAALNSLSKKLF